MDKGGTQCSRKYYSCEVGTQARGAEKETDPPGCPVSPAHGPTTGETHVVFVRLELLVPVFCGKLKRKRAVRSCFVNMPFLPKLLCFSLSR